MPGREIMSDVLYEKHVLCHSTLVLCKSFGDMQDPQIGSQGLLFFIAIIVFVSHPSFK